jgi:hypothetical protein
MSTDKRSPHRTTTAWNRAPIKTHTKHLSGYERALLSFTCSKINSDDFNAIKSDLQRVRQHGKPKKPIESQESAVLNLATLLGLEALARIHNDDVLPSETELRELVISSDRDQILTGSGDHTGSLIDPLQADELFVFMVARLARLHHDFPAEHRALSELIDLATSPLYESLSTYSIDKRELFNAANQISHRLELCIQALHLHRSSEITNIHAHHLHQHSTFIANVLEYRRIITPSQASEMRASISKLITVLT